MKKSLLLILLFLCTSLFSQTSTAPSGTGTLCDPYLISSLDNLYWITQNPSSYGVGKNFVQTADIDASSTSSWNSGAGFPEIGTFQAKYNGAGFTIYGIVINRIGSRAGIFGYLSNATIENLTITSPDITVTSGSVTGNGIVAGVSANSTITNVKVVGGSMSYSGSGFGFAISGFIGDIWGSTITSCSTSASVTSNNNMTGGFVGRIAGASTFTKCSVSSTLSISASSSRIGLFVGQTEHSSGIVTFNECFASGSITAVSGSGFIGGFIGLCFGNINFNNCYSSVSLPNLSGASGFWSRLWSANSASNTVNFNNCYSIGSVPNDTAGGFGTTASSTFTYSNCFWDNQTSGKSNGLNGSNVSGLTGKTSPEMKVQSTFESANWDFTNTWAIASAVNNGYPNLIFPSVTVTGFLPCVPTITTTGTLTSFSTCQGTASTNQTLTVSGSNLTSNIIITSPTGFDISTNSSSGFGSTVTLTRSGTTVATTSLFLRVSALASGSPSGNISFTSTGASTINRAVSATVNVLPTITGIQNITVGGNTLQLTGSGTPASVNPWASSNSAAAIVSAAGVVSAINTGTTTITYTSNTGCNATATITVVATTPAAPTSLTATSGNGQTQISFTAGSDGGATITNYEYSINGGTNWLALNPVDTTSPIIITGLTNGTNYNIKLRAVNSVGAGASSASVSVTPDINLAVLGGITIVSSAGDAENSTWSYSNGMIFPTSGTAVSINASDVLAKLALGNLTIGASSIDINETLSYATNANGITFKTTGNIVLAPSKSVTTNGGHVVLWSNADGEATNGGIFLKEGSSIVTAGGHVWLGGGNTATTWNGLTVGNGYAVSGRSVSDMRIDMWKPAIGFDQVTLSSSGGNIYIAGQRNENSTEGAGFINYSGTGTLIDAGSGTIVLKGYNTGTGAGLGVMTGLHPGSYSGRFVVKSSNATAVNAIAIEGSTTVSTQPAVLIENHTRLISSATSNGGAISISGVSTNNALSIGTVWGPGTLDVLSASGSINVNLGNNPLSIYGADSFFRLGSIESDTDVASSSANVVVTSNNVSWAGSVPIRTSGTLTVTPTNGNSFASAFNTSALNYNGISGLTIGNTSNTSAITIGSATSVAGPITVYGGNITLDGNINTSTGNANGDILLKATGAIVQNATRTITTNGGDVIFWADADGNNAGDIFFNPNGSISTNSGHLWLGGGSGTATWNGLTVGDGYAVGDVGRTVQSFTHYNGITIQGTNIQTAGGHIQMRGKGKAGDFTGSNFSGGMYLLDAGSMNSGDGTIDIQTLSNTGTGQKYGLYNLGPYTFAPGSGNLTITGDASASSSGTTNLTGSGVFIWTSVSPISSSGAISITGKKSSTAGTFGVDIRTPITTTAGNITVSGDVVNAMANVSASGNISYDASVSLTQTAVVTANGLSLNGTGNFTLNNISNNITTLAGGNNTTKLGSVSFTDAIGGLTIGTVGANSGLTASGTISVETLADNLTISNNITTDNTTANAIIINAGKSAAIGTATGGNIVLSGSPTITTGTGGIAKLFSGAASTALTAFVGGLANTRNAVDETIITFSPALTSGLYALYRASNPVAPTDISLSATSINENNAINAVVGTLTTTDADSGDIHSYTLVSGSGDTDNTSFTISGNQLRASVAFDFETKASYSVRIKTTDAAGLSFEKEFVINVLDLVENLAPTNISLSATSINENNAINAVVGTLTTTDTDSGDTHTYTLVSGLGATDNTSFTISGNQLRASVAFDFETKSSYSVRIKTIDASGLSFEKAFTILINNVNETPVLSSPQSSIVAVVGLPITPFVISNATSGTTTYAISPALPSGMLFNTTTGSITGTPTVAKATITYTIIATTSDGSASLTFTLFVDQDTDRDGILDSTDTDDDGDTILDINDAFPLDKNEWKDTDGDGIGDNADTDDDNDGILDVCDVDVNGDGIPDNGVDMDGDGIIDSCDTDRDGDGVNNTSDNCPDLPNTDQADRDRDGKGDVCDTTELNVSEGLTPNGDGINDTWVVYNLENHPGSIIRVFNANGKEVFYSNNYQNDWAGNYQGSSEMLPVGSYLYQIDLSGNGSIDVQGWLYITK